MSIASSGFVSEVFHNPEAYATELLAIVVSNFSTEAFEWDPQTLSDEVYNQHGMNVPAVNLDKIHGLITALTTDMFYQDPVVFWQSTLAFSNEPADFQTLGEPPTAEQCAWAVAEVGLNDPPEKDQQQPQFSGEVATLVGKVLHLEGFIRGPKPLSFAKIPEPGSDVLSETILQAREQRQSRLEEMLAQTLQSRAAELNKRLRSLPPSVVEASPATASTDASGGRDFVADAIDEARGDRR